MRAGSPGVEKDAVRIIPSACGGGFGGKLDASIQLPLAVAAWKLKRPVRAIYTRIESPAFEHEALSGNDYGPGGKDPDGLLTAFEMQADFDTGAYASWGPTVADRVPVHASGPYLVPNVSIDSRSIYTNAPPSGAFRFRRAAGRHPAGTALRRSGRTARPRSLRVPPSQRHSHRRTNGNGPGAHP